MPTYVYKFVDTGETIEVHQDFSDDALTEALHPVDGTMRPVKKVFLPVGITFKGGGFYKTDSKSGSSSGSSAGSSSGSSTGSSSDSTSTASPGTSKSDASSSSTSSSSSSSSQSSSTPSSSPT